MAEVHIGLDGIYKAKGNGILGTFGNTGYGAWRDIIYMVPSLIRMIREHFYYARRLYINTRQDTRDDGRINSKTNVGNNIKTGPVFIIKGIFNINGINRRRAKKTFHKLWNIWMTCFEIRITRDFTLRIQINHIRHFRNAVFAVSVHVNWVKFSSKIDTWKVIIELNKHYAGMWTSCWASISFFGTTLSRVLT